MTLTPGAQAWAAILTALVDPRTPDDNLADMVGQLKEDAARSMLVALAAMHSSYILEEATREGVTTAEMMAEVRAEILENTEASEHYNRGGCS